MKKLLIEGEHKTHSIEALSEMIGFKSKSVFYQSFKEQTGMTPTEFIAIISSESSH